QANLQVLYGPQGTLFGRNTSGGALLITTTRPSANGSSYLQATIGNYNTIKTEGGINIPLTDTLLTRFSFRTENTDGYITHLLDDGTSNDINDQSFRAQVRWIPTAQLTADLLYEHDESDTHNTASIFVACTDAGFPEKEYNLVHAKNYCSLYQPLAD